MCTLANMLTTQVFSQGSRHTVREHFLGPWLNRKATYKQETKCGWGKSGNKMWKSLDFWPCVQLGNCWQQDQAREEDFIRKIPTRDSVSPSLETQMEKAMAPHSSTLAWKIPWAEELGRLQSMRSLRVGHDWATSLSLFTFTHWRRKWQPTPVFLPGESLPC